MEIDMTKDFTLASLSTLKIAIRISIFIHQNRDNTKSRCRQNIILKHKNKKKLILANKIETKQKMEKKNN